VHAAATAASTTGRYSGRQPAITAFTATFSTVHGTRSGGAMATISSGARLVPESIASTRFSVGGTSGRPSLQPRSNIASTSSSSSASSTRRERSTPPPKRTRRSGARSGATESEPQPGRQSGKPSPSPSTPVSCCHSSRCQPRLRSRSTPPSTRISVGTASMSQCHDISSSRSSIDSTPSGNARSSCVKTLRSTCLASSRSTGATVSQVGQSRFTKATMPLRTGSWGRLISLNFAPQPAIAASTSAVGA